MSEQLIEPHFKNIKREITAIISEAKYSIKVASAWFRDPELIQILRVKAKNGVSVKVIVSGDQKNSALNFDSLRSEGVEIFICGPSDYVDDNFMHNKFCIVDSKIVLTGSYNWTKSASANYENIVTVKSITTALEYTGYFNELLMSSKLGGLDDSTNDLHVHLASDRELVRNNEEVLFTWNVANAEEIYWNDTGEHISASGKKKVKIASSKTFTITARGDSGIKSSEVFIRTYKRANITEFSVSEKTIFYGMPVTVEWRTAAGEHVVISINGHTNEVAGSGQISLCPEKDTTVSLIVTDEAGDLQSQNKIIYVFPRPIIKSIEVPCPTKISLEANVNVLKTFLPSALNLKPVKSGLYSTTPELFINRSQILSVGLDEVAKASNVTPQGLKFPRHSSKTSHPVLSRVLRKMYKLFNRDPKATEILNKINELYNGGTRITG